MAAPTNELFFQYGYPALLRVTITAGATVNITSPAMASMAIIQAVSQPHQIGLTEDGADGANSSWLLNPGPPLLLPMTSDMTGFWANVPGATTGSLQVMFIVDESERLPAGTFPLHPVVAADFLAGTDI
jgi:hypothetical protein